MARFFDRLIEKIQTDGVEEVLFDANTFNNENYTYHANLDPFSVPCGSSSAGLSGGRLSAGRSSDNQSEMADILGELKLSTKNF